MTPVLRPIQPHEHAQTIRLWHTVFNTPDGFFARYYEVDPWYQVGDTVGAWVGDELVSAVHVCRRPLVWGDTTLLCGGIANVATLTEHRQQGLSRQLLTLIITHMEENGFDFSLLGTGVPGHYAKLGWELAHPPHCDLALGEPALTASRGASVDRLTPAHVTEAQGSFYAQSPRLGQLERPPRYAEGWAGWQWKTDGSLMGMWPGVGYLVVSIPDAPEQHIWVQEWRAGNAAAEEALFREAVNIARAHDRSLISFAALPQYDTRPTLEALGTISSPEDDGKMIRNVRLPEAQYHAVKAAYQSGEAGWWPADAF